MKRMMTRTERAITSATSSVCLVEFGGHVLIPRSLGTSSACGSYGRLGDQPSEAGDPSPGPIRPISQWMDVSFQKVELTGFRG